MDTEKPPEVSVVQRANRSLGLGPRIELDFAANPDAGRLFARWAYSGRMWEAFGDWADGQPDRDKPAKSAPPVCCGFSMQRALDFGGVQAWRCRNRRNHPLVLENLATGERAIEPP